MSSSPFIIRPASFFVFVELLKLGFGSFALLRVLYLSLVVDRDFLVGRKERGLLFFFFFFFFPFLALPVIIYMPLSIFLSSRYSWNTKLMSEWNRAEYFLFLRLLR